MFTSRPKRIPSALLGIMGALFEFLRSGNRAKAVVELRRVLEYDPEFDEARAKLDELGEDS